MYLVTRTLNSLAGSGSIFVQGDGHCDADRHEYDTEDKGGRVMCAIGLLPRF